MGNHASSGERRDRAKGGEFTPYSPSRVGDGQAFTFDHTRPGAGQHKTLQQQSSEEDHDPVILKVTKVRLTGVWENGKDLTCFSLHVA